MGVVRYPRMRVEVAGQTLVVESASVSSNGYFHADSAKATLPIWGGDGRGDAWWLDLGADGSTVPMKVYHGEGSTSGAITWGAEPLFDGFLEEKDLSLDTNLVSLSGHDKTMLLIKDKTKAAYANLSAAEIITKLASKAGLDISISGADKLAGQIYSANHVKLLHGELSKTTTAWDVVCLLARQTGNVAYVKGNTLYVRPNDPDHGSAYHVRWSSPVIAKNLVTWPSSWSVDKLAIKHNLLAAKDITVQVIGFHSKKGTRFSQVAGPVRNRNNADQSNYSFGPYPNLTPDQAQAKANQLYRDLTIHEYDLNIEGPADFGLTPYQTIIVDGSAGPLAQTFWISEVEWNVDQSSGARMTVTGKNHPDQNDTTVG